MTKTAIVTGAGSGIGRATAQALLVKGWQVALLGRREKPLQDLADRYDTALAVSCDVTDPDAVHRGFDQAVAEFGHLDLLFNNAGIFPKAAPIDQLDLKDWQNSLDVNLNGAFYCARKAFGMMRKQSPQGGRIINNGSVSAQVARPNSAAYTITKHAITGLTKSLNLDGRGIGIVAGQIDIGNARTELFESVAKKGGQAGTSPEPSMAVEEAAAAVVHMAELPLSTNIPFMTIMASEMLFMGRG